MKHMLSFEQSDNAFYEKQGLVEVPAQFATALFDAGFCALGALYDAEGTPFVVYEVTNTKLDGK